MTYPSRSQWKTNLDVFNIRWNSTNLVHRAWERGWTFYQPRAILTKWSWEHLRAVMVVATLMKIYFTSYMNAPVFKFFGAGYGRYVLQVAGCRLGVEFNYNWKTAGTLEERTCGRLPVNVTWHRLWSLSKIASTLIPNPPKRWAGRRVYYNDSRPAMNYWLRKKRPKYHLK